MGKGRGGGSSAPQQTEVTQTTTNLPEYAQPYFTRLLGRTEYESLNPYRTYTGQRLAERSPFAEQVAARQTALGLAGAPREMGEASQIARDVAAQTPITAGQQIASFRPEDINVNYEVERFQGFRPAERYDAQRFDSGIASMYMNPFQRLVTDVEKREAQRASDISGEQIESRAAQSGGLGGYREAILQAERERNLGQRLGDIEARGQRDAFAQAQQQFERDRANQLNAARQQLASAQFLGAQAPMQQRLAFDRLRQAQQAQEIGRNFRQAGLDMAYKDFLNQIAYPRQQLGFYGQILQGLPVTPGTQISQYAPSPSGTQQLLGLGLGGLGLYRALSGGMG